MLKIRVVNIVALLMLASLLMAEVLVNIPSYPFILLFISYVAAVAYGSVVMSAQMFGINTTCGDSSKRQIALTFDDGPIPGKTEEVLRILEQHHVKAAFFCIGSRVNGSPDLVNEVVKRGHIVGNHSYSHKPWFGFLSFTKVRAELAAANSAIFKVIGKEPVFFRPPYGVTNPMIGKAAFAGNFHSIGWSIRSFDTVISNTGSLLKRVTTPLKNGDVVLFHDYSDSMLAILPDFIAYARNKGYEIVRLDVLLNQEPYR
ncbi:MAG TPA: polysaccharide deacetylase family protein [Chryseosolibacter sp.]|nr:polysaccharide deacetylase family protein [Chryseosolibacter sp.]